MSYIYRFFNKIRNLIRWFPLIWNDNPWDYIYIYQLLLAKFSFDAEFYKSSEASSLEADRISRELEQACELLKRLIEGSYQQEETEKLYGIKIEEASEESLLNFFNNRTQEDIIKSKELYDKIEAEEEKDMEKLFSLMRGRIKYWWD